MRFVRRYPVIIITVVVLAGVLACLLYTSDAADE